MQLCWDGPKVPVESSGQEHQQGGLSGLISGMSPQGRRFLGAGMLFHICRGFQDPLVCGGAHHPDLWAVNLIQGCAGAAVQPWSAFSSQAAPRRT